MSLAALFALAVGQLFPRVAAQPMKPPVVVLLTTVLDGHPVGRCQTGARDAGDEYAGANQLERALIQELRPQGWIFLDPCAVGVEQASKDQINREGSLRVAQAAGATFALLGSLTPSAHSGGKLSPLFFATAAVNLRIVELASAEIVGAKTDTFGDSTTASVAEDGAVAKALGMTVPPISEWLRDSILTRELITSP